jgi:hypothetical protein
MSAADDDGASTTTSDGRAGFRRSNSGEPVHSPPIRFRAISVTETASRK